MHRRRSLDPRLALACLVVVACLTALSCAPSAPSTKIELPTRQFTVGQFNLPSGLRILVDEDPGARGVASALVVGAGSADDPEQLAGLAHLVEHLTFRAHRPGQASLTGRLAMYGIGLWNADTTFDTTTFYEAGAPETLPRMIEVGIARLTDPLQGVTNEQFETERGVVISELGWRDESGRFQEVQHALFGQLFPPGHAYAHGVGGDRQSLQRATLEQARAWTREHYLPRTSTWVIVGAVTTAEVQRWLEAMLPQSLRDPGPTDRPRRNLAVPSRGPAPAVPPTVTAPVDRPELYLVWDLPPARGKEEPAFQTLAGMVEGRAHRVEGVKDADATLLALEHASLLELTLQLTDKADPVKVLADLQRVIGETWKPPQLRGSLGVLIGKMIEESFARSRTAALVAIARANDSILTRAVFRAQRGQRFGSTSTLKEQSDALVNVSFADVYEAGRVYVTHDGYRAVLIKPLPGGERESEKRTGEEVPSAFSPEVAPAEYPAEVVSKFVRGPDLAKATRFQATTGLEVVTVPRGRSGLVTVTLAFPGGRRTSTPPGLADRLQWSEQDWGYGTPFFIGAGVRSWWSDDTGYVEYQGSVGNFPNLLAMLSERILSRHAVDPPKEIVEAKVLEPENAKYEQRFWHSVFGETGDPIRRPAAQVAALKGSLAQTWLERQLDPKRAVLVVAGDVPPTVQAEVEHWLARWKSPSTTDAATLPPLPPAPGNLRLVKDGSSGAGARQVKVRFVCTASAQSVEERLAIQLIAAEIERQWSVVERETLGSSYGFSSDTNVHRDGSMSLTVWGRVDRAGVRRMAVAVAQIWKGLPQAGSADRLNRLRWEFGRVFNVRYLASGALAGAVADERLRGASPTSLDDVPAALMRLGPEQMSAVGTQCQRSAVLGLRGDPAVLGVESLLPPGTQQVP